MLLYTQLNQVALNSFENRTEKAVFRFFICEILQLCVIPVLQSFLNCIISVRILNQLQSVMTKDSYDVDSHLSIVSVLDQSFHHAKAVRTARDVDDLVVFQNFFDN